MLLQIMDTGPRTKPLTSNRVVTMWLIAFASIIACLIVFGAFVRLTRSGLSIVEWNPISGVIPPLNHAAWLEEFARYQRSPEYIKINSWMTLEEYQFIFWMEWIHRFIARLAGLFYAIPAFYFLFTKRIPWREFGAYFIIGMLFISQALAGWMMVASGLVDRPTVSHFKLTIHLLLALSLFGITLWMIFVQTYGRNLTSNRIKWSSTSKLALVFFVLLVLQISYGGMTAGLKAGYISNTWPLMLGNLIPPNLFNSVLDLVELPQTIVFIHRWFAFVILVIVLFMFVNARRCHYLTELKTGFAVLFGMLILQVILGIFTVLTSVNIVIAILHQAVAIALFALSLYFIHRFRALDRYYYR